MKEFRRLFMDEDLAIPRIEGALNVAREIRESGLKVGLVTGKIKYFVEKHLKEAGFDLNMFDVIASFETTQKHKPDPEPLLHVIEKLHVKPEETVYVGDAISDFECAKNAGIRCCCFDTIPKKGRTGRTKSREQIESVVDLPSFLGEAF